jgi:hypothetical protein
VLALVEDRQTPQPEDRQSFTGDDIIRSRAESYIEREAHERIAKERHVSTRRKAVDCGGPDRCIDDLCRGQDYGICGRMSAETMCIELGIHTGDCERYHEDDYLYDPEDRRP